MIWRAFSALFVKEKYAWILICLCGTSLLLFEILVDFFIAKPTVTSVEAVNHSEISFPDVLVCLGDGFDSRALKQVGYEDSFHYILGQDTHGNFIGWNGLDNEDSLRRDLDKNVPHLNHYYNHIIALLLL